MSGAITQRDLLKVSLRLLLVQVGWTSTSMQSEGLVYCIAPALKKLFPDPKQLNRTLRHYRIPINTHPFLVSVLAGTVIRMEEQKQSSKSILSFLKTTMGPLAALGDPFFQVVLALSSVLSAILAFMFGAVWGIVALIVLFNGVHLFLRFYGIFVGYNRGEHTFTHIGNVVKYSRIHTLRILTGLSAGVLIGYISHAYTPQPILWLTTAVAGVASIMVAFLLYNKRAIWTYVLPAFLLATLILEVVL